VGEVGGGEDRFGLEQEQGGGGDSGVFDGASTVVEEGGREGGRDSSIR